MGLGVGIFLIAVGAVLAFAIHATANGVDLHTIGYILMGGRRARHHSVVDVLVVLGRTGTAQN
jgi:Domain of unknown function (DUF6458)